MKNSLYLLPLLVIFLMSSCKKDTCNAKLGDTFDSLDAPGITVNALSIPTLVVDMVTLDVLPESYFLDAVLITNVKNRFGEEWDNDHALVDQFVFQQDAFEITFTGVNLITQGQIVLHFRFGDRKNYIDCDHGGAGDSYFLDLDFSVGVNEQEELVVRDFNWSEDFKAGPY